MIIWASDESYSSPKGHHQVGASPYRLSVFGNPSYLCIFGNSWVLSNWHGNAVFLRKWLRRTIILMWKRKTTKKRSCLRHHLDFMCGSCWLASVACVGLFSSAYPIVFVFLEVFVSWMSASSACSMYFRSKPPDTTWFLLTGFAVFAHKLRQRKKKKWDSKTYYVDKVHWKRNKTYIHLIHLMLSEKRSQIWAFMMQSKAVVATGLSRQICHCFWVSVGIGWGYRWVIPRIWSNMLKIVMSRSSEDTPIGCRIANSQF